MGQSLHELPEQGPNSVQVLREPLINQGPQGALAVLHLDVQVLKALRLGAFTARHGPLLCIVGVFRLDREARERESEAGEKRERARERERSDTECVGISQYPAR